MEKRYTIGVMIGNANSPHTMNLMQGYKQFLKIIYVFLTIFLYLLKCPQSLIL